MTCFCFYLSSNILKDENFRIFEFNNGLYYIKSCFICIVDCKTTPSFARSAKIEVFERVFARGREMGKRGEEGVTSTVFQSNIL